MSGLSDNAPAAPYQAFIRTVETEAAMVEAYEACRKAREAYVRTKVAHMAAVEAYQAILNDALPPF
jgi:hypothetical protein